MSAESSFWLKSRKMDTVREIAQIEFGSGAITEQSYAELKSLRERLAAFDKLIAIAEENEQNQQWRERFRLHDNQERLRELERYRVNEKRRRNKELDRQRKQKARKLDLRLRQDRDNTPSAYDDGFRYDLPIREVDDVTDRSAWHVFREKVDQQAAQMVNWNYACLGHPYRTGRSRRYEGFAYGR